jgi:ribosomal-protein-alanine N-acetyltransferase
MTRPPTRSAFEWEDELPTLETSRLVLRHPAPADSADLFAVFSDPEVMRYWSDLPMRAPQDADDYIAQIDAHFHERDLFQWAVEQRTTARVVGTCTLLNVSTAHQRAEIGFALGRRHWGQGLATEVVHALLSFAFETLTLHRLEADVDPRNERSLRLLERLGFQREGYLRERYFVGGERQDTVLLGLLRRDWQAPRESSAD